MCIRMAPLTESVSRPGRITGSATPVSSRVLVMSGALVANVQEPVASVQTPRPVVPSESATVPVAAQEIIDSPNFAEFLPSTDHDTVLIDGTPAVTSYQLEIYAQGAGAPFTSIDIGKPPVDADS